MQLHVRTLSRHRADASRPRGCSANRRGSRSSILHRVNAVSTATVDRAQPAWTGNDLPSKFVNALIASPLFPLMKMAAKWVIVNDATKSGIPWQQHVKEMESKNSELRSIMKEIECKDITYPSYYLKEFHAYSEGNLNWLAAYEVEPASYSMAVRTFKDPSMSPQQAFDKLRDAIGDALKGYYAQHSLPAPQTIVDVGCSVGVSTRWLQQQYPQATIMGLDLSPHFLAVAEYQERNKPADQPRIKYIHGLAEKTDFADHSLDLVAYQFIIHECPQQAIRDFVAESKRTLKSGGVLMFVDNNPKSKTIQNLPPAIATLMKSTEPWSDEYYSFDVEAAMREAGFKEVMTKETDHRHRAVLGIAA